MDAASETYGVTPLGVTIAKKQLENQEDDIEREQHQKKKKKKKQQQQQTPRQKQVITTSWSKKKKDKKTKNPSWVSLVEGVTLYGLCLFVPSLLGILMSLEWSQVQAFMNTYVVDQICLRSKFFCWHLFGMVLPEPEPELTFTNFAPDTNLSDIYVILGLTLTMACCRVFLVHWLVPNHLAPQQMEALVRCKSIHLLSSEYKQSLTPRETPRNVIDLHTFQKESSSRLGSSSARKLSLPLVPDWNEGSAKTALQETHEGDSSTGNEAQEGGANIMPRGSDLSNDLGLSIDTPKSNRPVVGLDSFKEQKGGFLEACSPMPGSLRYDDDGEQDDNSQQHFNIEEDYDNEEDEHATTSFPSSSPQKPLDQQETVNEDEDEEPSVWKRRGSAASLAAAAAAAVQEEENHHAEHYQDHDMDQNSQNNNSSPSPPRRLFAAPRYATAVFRLLYCTLSCIMAWYLFKDADFWPSYVGGHGSTKRCWDLSGSLSLAKNLDSDFDHRNTVLRRFFLVQASYHLHSGAFHIASVALLYLLKKKVPNEDSNSKEEDNEASSPSKTRSLFSLLRSLIHPRALLQHTLSLGWLSVSYVFSSLRRLGAIGMFALDMSSWALHLLQACLNAPADSILSQPKVIRAVWLLLVCPTFLYFRFYVWPLVGYSAMVESERWLAQLESTLIPGSAAWFRRTMQVWMALWMGFHAIHFKRLVFHPHIQRIMTANATPSPVAHSQSEASDVLYESGKLS